MPGQNLPARDKALQLISEALATGVRGPIREHLKKAQKAAEGERTTGLTRLDFEKLAVGAKLRDQDRPGLYMRHGKRTGRVWIYRHLDAAGKVVEHQFGTFPELSVADARAEWENLRASIHSGRPIQVESAEVTMKDLVDRYLGEYASVHKRSWRMDESYLTKYVLPHYANLPAAEFNADHVRAILTPISARAPREAEKVRGVLSSMFSVAIRGSRKMGNLAGTTWLPPTTINPASQVILPERAVQSYSPTTGDLLALMQGIQSDAGDVAQALALQAFTCARVTEVAALPWAELDLPNGTWLLPAGRAKNGKAHLVMLPTQAIDLLNTRREGRAGNGAFVFPGMKFASHVTRNHIAKLVAANREDWGLNPKFTSHSLRHACLTWLAENGAGREIRDRVSNHVDGTSIDAVYNRALLNKPAQEWLQRWADYLEGLT